MELYRAKNVATIIVFPLVDADGDFVSSAGSLDSEIDTWADGAGPDGFADCTNEAAEIGTTGLYSLSLTQTEMNNDYIVVQVKSASAKTQCILINTKPITANVTQFGGSAGTFASGRPETNTTHIAGSAVSTSTAQLGVNVVNAGGTAWGSGAITASAIATDAITAAKIANGAIDAATFAADALARFGVVASGTAQAATGTTIQLASGETFADDTPVGMTVLAFGSTQGYWQSRVITDYAGATDTATVDTWTVTPSGTITYVLLGTAPASTSAPVPAQVVAFSAAGLADLFDTDSGTTYASAVAGSVVKEIADNAGGSALTAAGIADAVWDEALAGHTTSGTAGERLGRVPNVAAGASGGLPTVDANNAVKVQSGTGANQISLSSGAVLLQATQPGVTIPTVTTVTNLTNAPTAGDFTATMKTSIGTAVAASAVASVTGNVGGNVTGSVGSVAAGGISAASLAADAITAAKVAADVGTEIAAAVLSAAGTTPIAADVKKINTVTITGTGVLGDEFGP